MIELPVIGENKSYRVSPSKIIALGLNYHDHIRESVSAKARGITDRIPSEPVLFAKTPNVLIGPGEPIVIPRFLNDYEFKTPRIDYEAELALIIGKDGKNIPADEVESYILGYSCMNDISQRNFQNHDVSGWFRGKSLDTFGPIGPVIVPPHRIGDPQNLRIQCHRNGKVVQDSNTRQMIFSIRDIIVFISRHFTVKRGDIIMTGTPQGVGPIQAGDVIEVEIEKIGVLQNPVVAE